MNIPIIDGVPWEQKVAKEANAMAEAININFKTALRNTLVYLPNKEDEGQRAYQANILFQFLVHATVKQFAELANTSEDMEFQVKEGIAAEFKSFRSGAVALNPNHPAIVNAPKN